MVAFWPSSVGVEGTPRSTAPCGGARRWCAATGGGRRPSSSVVAAGLLIGPAVGVLALLFTGAAFNVVNLIAGVVYVAALPFAAIALTYLYFDLRVRHEEAAATPAPAGDLPQELDGPVVPPDRPATA